MASKTPKRSTSSSMRRASSTTFTERSSRTWEIVTRRFPMQLEGKRALITGAGSGIGQRLAIEAAKRGVSLIITGRRPEALNVTLAKLPGHAHYAFAADVTKPEDRAALIEAVRQHWGGLDLLVNNAGVVPVGALAQSTDDEL